jgi:predicted Rossmann fold nucleotide-binding protein DprA/Smf involved in DNA uptake
MKVAIVGSRKYPNLEAVRRFIRELPRDTTVVTGGAYGVDEAAEETAKRLRLSRQIFEPIVGLGANRQEYVKALLERNHRIVEAADRVVVFWDGKSSGTKRVAALAMKAGLPVEVRES